MKSKQGRCQKKKMQLELKNKNINKAFLLKLTLFNFVTEMLYHSYNFNPLIF